MFHNSHVFIHMILILQWIKSNNSITDNIIRERLYSLVGVLLHNVFLH